jgi:hypothetical protein
MKKASDDVSISSKEANEFLGASDELESQQQSGLQLEADPVLLEDVLMKANLQQYEEMLQHLGAETAIDLQELATEDLITNGVTSVHARRLLRISKEMQLNSLGALPGPSRGKTDEGNIKEAQAVEGLEALEIDGPGAAVDKRSSLEHRQGDEVSGNSSGLATVLGLDVSATSAQNLHLLHCAMQLAAGKQDQIGEYLEKMDGTKLTYTLSKYVSQTKLGNPCAPYPSTKWIKLCESARTAGYICPPYQDNLPGLELSKKWSPGRAIAEWMEQWSVFSLGVIWQRLASVMDLMSHARKVCAIAACATYSSPEEAEIVALQYDHVVRRRMWDKYRERPSAELVSLYLSGEKEGLLSEAERLAKLQPRTYKDTKGDKYCMKFGFGISCDPQRCRLRHACPYCNSTESGCVKMHAGRFGYQQQKGIPKGGKGDAKGYGKGNAARREANDRDRRERSRSQQGRRR